MEGNKPYITNLVNSIIGVSVLAMPFCMKQCGLILGLGLLFSAAWLTYISCSMLATSAHHKRRRTYEYLALSTLGPTGKFAVELSMIGLMLGTCVAFYVVIGDLSMDILSKFVDGSNPHTMRIYTIVFSALCIALPLGMMKNLAVLSYFGFFSLMFYVAFLFVVIFNAVSNGLLQWEWWSEVNLWRPAGIFQSLPIFSLAYACQCQLFIVYSSLEEPDTTRIEDIVSGAIKFVTIVYMSVGFFGYTTYRDNIKSGNLLVSFPSSWILDLIKLGFALSVVMGFPLMISPCRQSIHTLFFAKPSGEGHQSATYIPPFLFKSITLTIVLSTMTIAIVIPNVETILGLTGATMGSIICFIFPAIIYEKAIPKGTPAGVIPKFVFCLGCVLLIVCTYSNLTITAQTPEEPDLLVPKVVVPPAAIEEPQILENVMDGNNEDKPGKEEDIDKDPPKVVGEVVDPGEHRHEPPNPIETDDDDDDEADDSQQDLNKKPPVVPADQQEERNPDYPAKEVNIQLPPSPQEVAKQVSQDKKEEQDNAPKLSNPLVPPEKKEEAPLPLARDSPVVKQENKQEIQIDPVRKIQENQVNIPQKQEETRKLVDKDVQHLPADGVSPKIIKRDEDHEKQEVPKPVQLGAGGGGNVDPGRQQNLKQEEQKVDSKPKPSVNTLSENEKQEIHDSPEEKELLEKIKQQHDMQQVLLNRQEQLIKKLEEHQDKKEQEVEEKRDAGETKLEDARVEREAPAPIDGNIAHDKKFVAAAPLAPEDDILGGVKQLESKVDIPQGKVLVGDGIPLGRELLSQQNVDGVAADQENQQKVPSDTVKTELNFGVIGDLAPEKLAPGVIDMAHRQQNVADHPDPPLRALPRQIEPKNVEGKQEAAKDTFHQLPDPDQHPVVRKERALDEEEMLMMEKDSQEKIRGPDPADQGKVVEVQEEIKIKSKQEEENDKDSDVAVQEEEVEMKKDSLQEALDEIRKDSLEESNPNAENLEENKMELIKDSQGDPKQILKETGNLGNEEQGENPPEECPENDINCWQAKSKSRELKSLNLNDL